MKQSPTLNQKLDQYSIAVGSQTVSGKSAAEWIGYAAAAGASLAMAGSAEAAIIYSGIQNITAEIDPTAQISNNTNQKFFNIGGSNFKAGVVFALSGTPGSFKYVGGAILAATSSAQALILGAPGAGGYNGSFLNASQVDIGPNGVFSASGGGNVRTQTSSGNNGFGQFALGATGLIGVKLGSGNYGWIRLKVEDMGINQPFSSVFGGALGNGLNYADKITVIDWAYENTGAAIHAGRKFSFGGALSSDNTIPEPSALALLAAGAAGIGAFRRRKAAQGLH
ncbi:MAG: PEP-CTERM sorting domain-containing protein [Methylococcales bacterium]|nr:PEP-CTERM sorting domain-containing protein [Methylococcales bacterium]